VNCFHDVSVDERCYCEPFVLCYNRFYNRTFAYADSPDRRDRRTPQPDALYGEGMSGDVLVIERKRIFHPSGKDNYARGHHNDHVIMDYLSKYLDPELANGPFVMKMPLLHFAERDDDIIQHAREICDFIHQHKAAVLAGEELHFYSEEPCKGEYCFYQKDRATWFEEVDGPWTPMQFSLSGRGNRIPRFRWDRTDLSPIREIVQNCLCAASRKFDQYRDACKVVLLERHGDICGPVRPEFEALFSSVRIPSPIDEIWDAWIETPDCNDPYWTYTRVWSRDPEMPSAWLRAEICCTVGCYCKQEAPTDEVFWFDEVRNEVDVAHEAQSGQCIDEGTP
jgi:hypothetical protein